MCVCMCADTIHLHILGRPYKIEFDVLSETSEWSVVNERPWLKTTSFVNWQMRQINHSLTLLSVVLCVYVCVDVDVYHL